MALALVFDLDGTLVDTVYAHVFAWQRALAEAGMPIDGWRIHRRVGMSGGLFARAVAREVGRELSAGETEEIQRRHGAIFGALLPERRPLPGARELRPARGGPGTDALDRTPERRLRRRRATRGGGVPRLRGRRRAARVARRARRGMSAVRG